MPCIWITGAHGFIGRNLAHYLNSAGHIVVGLGHGSWPEAQATHCGLSSWLNGEIDASNLTQLLDQFGPPHIVYHLAGGSAVGPSFKHPLEDFRRTVDTTARLFDWIYRNSQDTKVVCVSSAAVYGSGHSSNIDEEAKISPFSPYGYNKAMMEIVCQSYAVNFQLSVAIVRLFSVYGQGLKKQLIWDLCNLLNSGRQKLILGGTGREIRDWIHISEVVRLLDIVSNSCSPACPVINGGTGLGTNIASISKVVNQVWGTDTDIAFNNQPRVGDPEFLVADIHRARSVGFNPQKKLVDGIKETINWFKIYLKVS